MDENTTLIIQFFSLRMKEAEVDEALDELEALCRKYALSEDDWTFKFKTED